MGLCRIKLSGPLQKTGLSSPRHNPSGNQTLLTSNIGTQEERTGILIAEGQLLDHLVGLDRKLHQVGDAGGTHDIAF